MSYTSDKFNLNKITAQGVWRSLKRVQIEFDAYANQLVQANEKEARRNNTRRFQVIHNYKWSSPSSVVASKYLKWFLS
jgi:hypothetical protein